MGRKATWPPKVTEHKASGQSRVRFRGRDYYLGPHDSQEARDNYRRLLDRLEDAPAEVAAPKGMLVSEAVRRWLADEGKRYNGRELDHYSRSLAVLLEVAAAVRVGAFGVADLERVRRAMLARDWSAGLVNRRITRVRTVWRWLERQGHAPRGSWDHLRTLPGIRRNDPRARHTSPRRPAEWAEVARVCRCSPPAIRALLLLGWFTGARPGELTMMRACDIDRTDPGVWVYRPASHKNAWRGHERVIALGHVAQKVLAPFLQERKPDAYLFRPSSRCRRRKRDYYEYRVLARAVQRAAARAGAPGFHFYRLRHSYRLRISREFGLDAARAALGHTSVDMTAKYAAGADLKLAQDVARRAG